MMRVAALAGIVALLVLAAGCGAGSGSTSARTELRRYLERVTREQTRYEATRARVVAALRTVSSTGADGSWTRAAGTLRSSESEYDALMERLRTIQPPALLRSQHAGMIESLRLYKRLLDGMQGPLARRDVVAFGRTVGQTTTLGVRANRLRIRWRSAAQAAALRLGVAFPARLRHVGAALAEEGAAGD